MSKPTVCYSSFCCPKDMERFIATQADHIRSHGYRFDEVRLVQQRCKLPLKWPPMPIPEEYNDRTLFHEIVDADYPKILHSFGIKYPDPVADYITKGWESSHFHAHHLVNHLKVLEHAKSDYIVFADADCYVKDQAEGVSWVDVGINTLENNPEMFVVCPSDGRPDGGPDRMMSQQMFLINRKRFLEMEFLPWDGLFLENGPFAPFYFLMEGFIYRHMVKHNLYRYVLPKEIARWWHNQW